MFKSGYDWLDKALDGRTHIHTPAGPAVVSHILFDGERVSKIKVESGAFTGLEYDVDYLDKWRRTGCLRVGQNVYYGTMIAKIVSINYGVDGLPENIGLALPGAYDVLNVPASHAKLQPVEGAHQTQCKVNLYTTLNCEQKIRASRVQAESLTKRVLGALRKQVYSYAEAAGVRNAYPRFASGGFVTEDFLRSGEVAAYASLRDAYRLAYPRFASGGEVAARVEPKPLHQHVLDDYDTRVSKISGHVGRARRAEMMRRSLKRYYGDPENSFVREHYERNPDTGEVTFVRKGEAECPTWVLKEERSRRGVVIDAPKFTLEKAREICGRFGWYVTEKRSLRETQEKFKRIFEKKLWGGYKDLGERASRCLDETIEEMLR